MSKLYREQGKALLVPAEVAAVSVMVGADGAWLYLKASNGQEMAFQPVTQFNSDGVIDSAAKAWASDMQWLYENAEILLPCDDLDTTG